MAEKKVWPERTGTFTIKTIEGTGNSAQYYRIADHLVRNSRIFRHLCKRIYRLKGQVGLQRKYRLTNYYKLKDTKVEQRDFQREANKILKKAERKNILLQKKYKRLQDCNRALHQRVKMAVNVKNDALRRIETFNKKMKLVKDAEKYFSKPFTWQTNYVTGIDKAELMLRAVYAYSEGEKRNKFKEKPDV